MANTITQLSTSGILVELASNGVAYLKVGDDGRVYEETLQIIPEESLYFLTTMFCMQETISGARLSALDHSVTPQINTFLDIPIEQLDTWQQKIRSSKPR